MVAGTIETVYPVRPTERGVVHSLRLASGRAGSKTGRLWIDVDHWLPAGEPTPTLPEVARLPCRPGAAAGVLRETSVLQQLPKTELHSVVQTPQVRHVGGPHERFPHHWSVLEWIEGTDAWTARSDLDRHALDDLAADLAQAVIAIGRADIDGARARLPGSRGGPLGPLLVRLDGWLTAPGWNGPSLRRRRRATPCVRGARDRR